MNTKYLLTALAAALSAAADTLTTYAEDAPEATQGSVQHIDPAATVDAELDSEGLPWDERIHAGTRTKTAGGLWTKRRNLDDATRNKVVAELLQHYAAPEATETEAETPAAAPSIPKLNFATPAASNPYTQFVDWLAKNTGEGKALSKDWVDNAFKQNNVTLADLAPENMHDTAQQFLDGFRGVLQSMGVAEVK